VCKIVELVDEDGSAMVEFEEFLSIMKSGQMNAKSDAGDNGTGAIYNFFKKLSKGEIGDPNMSFPLLIG